MKGNVSPGVAAVIVIVVLVAVAWFGYKTLGPRTDGPTHPINMGAMMGQAGAASKAPYKKAP